MSLLLFLIFAAVWLRAALRAGLDRRFFYNPREGLWIALPIRLSLIAGNVGLIVYWLKPEWIVFAAVPLTDAWRWPALLPALAGTIYIHRVFAELGSFFSTSLDLKQQHRLICSGPYARLRHPMYLAYGLCWFGWCWLAANALLLSIGTLGMLWLMWFRTPREEAMLLASFGDDYRDYCRRSGRFLPRLRRCR